MRQQRCGDGVVAVGKDVGFHAHLVAYGALYRKPSAIDRGGDSFNDDALASVFLGYRHSGLGISSGAKAHAIQSFLRHD